MASSPPVGANGKMHQAVKRLKRVKRLKGWIDNQRDAPPAKQPGTPRTSPPGRAGALMPVEAPPLVLQAHAP